MLIKKVRNIKTVFQLLKNVKIFYSGTFNSILENSLFDSSYYIAQKPKITGNEVKLLKHYLIRGFIAGLDPHPLFSTSFYLETNPDVAKSGINPLAHYLESGFKEKRSPHPLFNIPFYLENHPDVAEAGVDPLIHYLQIGYREKRKPHPLFNVFYYHLRFRDVLTPQDNPLLHYIEYGSGQGEDCHPLFNSSYYLEKNPEAIESGMDPLIHFLRYGNKKPGDLYTYKKRVLDRKIQTILIFDHRVPRFDMDSGSVRLFNLIKILVEAGYNVILWAKSEPGDEYCVDSLEVLNVELPYEEGGLEDYLIKNGEGVDLVILHRLTIAGEYLDSAMALMHAKILFDTVDLTFLRNEREARLKGDPIEHRTRRQELHFARCADEVLVVSPVEKFILEKEGLVENVSVVTNIHSLESVNRSFDNRTGLMFIGGYKHSPNVDAMIWFVQSVFPLLEIEIPDIHLTIVGSHPPDDILKLARSNITVTGYVEDVTPHFEKARVFVSPLRFGAGVKGKIGQSMAYGLPVVTTSIGAEGMYLVDDESVLIGDGQEQFARQVVRAYNDRQLWERLAAGARNVIETYYSPEVVKKALLNVIVGNGKKNSQEQLQKLLNTLHFPVVDHPLVSVIIPTYGKVHYTLNCLRSIMGNPPQATVEIIIVDDASTDTWVEQLNVIPGIRLLILEQNQGFVGSCNEGAKHAQGKYLHFLNNDTHVCKGWLDSMLALFKQHENCGMVGSKLVYPDGRLQEAGGIIWSDASAWNFGHSDDPDRPAYNYVKEIDYASGASLLVKKQLFDSLGGFNQDYAPAYYEDVDLAFQIRRSGQKVYYQPESVVIHYEGVSHGTDITAGVKSHQLVNQQKILRDWKDTLVSEQYQNGDDVFHARDRSKNRKTILVVGYHAHKSEDNIGSKEASRYLQVLAETELNVKFWPYGLDYDEKYCRPLQQLGIEVYYGTRYMGTFRQWIETNGKYLDYVLLLNSNTDDRFVADVQATCSARIIHRQDIDDFVFKMKAIRDGDQ